MSVIGEIMFNGLNTSDIYWQNMPVSAVYFGSTLVWKKGSKSKTFYKFDGTTSAHDRRALCIASETGISKVTLKNITKPLTWCYSTKYKAVGTTWSNTSPGDLDLYGQEGAGTSDTVFKINADMTDSEVVLTMPPNVKIIILNGFNGWSAQEMSSFEIAVNDNSDAVFGICTGQYAGNMTR